jgi:hypothetical protein
LYIKEESIGNQEYDITPLTVPRKSLEAGPGTLNLLLKKKRLPTL